MAKRFTDTDKWERPWFRGLQNKYKILWCYILDKCDIAGVWYCDFELASFFIGEKFIREDAERVFDKQIEVRGDRWRIKDFVEFQYGHIDERNKIFKNVQTKLEAFHEPSQDGAYKGDIRGINAPKDKDKDKDKGICLKGGVGEKPTLDMIRDYFKALGHPEEAEPFFDNYEANGWRIGGVAEIHSWPALCRKWLRNPRREKDGKVSSQDRLKNKAKDIAKEIEAL
ncbi:MAG: hypothetical protein EOM51_11945 [Clostridia bacterium]|nr:hypothetical protein [Clostridia bacterium]